MRLPITDPSGNDQGAGPERARVGGPARRAAGRRAKGPLDHSGGVSTGTTLAVVAVLVAALLATGIGVGISRSRRGPEPVRAAAAVATSPAPEPTWGSSSVFSAVPPRLSTTPESSSGSGQFLFGVDVDLALWRHTMSPQGIDAAFSDAERLGVSFIRIGVDWSSLEPSRGDWNDAYLNEFFATLERYHLRALVELTGPPAWASSDPSAPDPYDYPPANPDDFGAYVAHVAAFVASHGKAPEVVGFKVLNEPSNLDNKTHCSFPPSTYAKLVTEAYEAVKRATPQLPVMPGGMWFTAAKSPRPGTCMTVDAYERAYLTDPANPVARHVDVVDLHAGAMPPAQVRSQIDELEQTMARLGRPDTPVWVDEFAYSSLPEHQTTPGYTCPTPVVLASCEQVQARFLADDAHEIEATKGAVAMSWTYLVDDPDLAAPDAGLGLDALVNRSRLREKPAYFAYRAIISSAGPQRGSDPLPPNAAGPGAVLESPEIVYGTDGAIARRCGGPSPLVHYVVFSPSTPGPHPVVFGIAGTGFAGSADCDPRTGLERYRSLDWVMTQWAKAGFVAVNIEYHGYADGLRGGATYPGPGRWGDVADATTELDVKAAMRFFLAHDPARYGADPGEGIVVFGTSSGAHSAYLLGATGLAPYRISAVVGWSGLPDAALAGSYPRAVLDRYMGATPGSDLEAFGDPYHRLSPTSPPEYVANGASELVDPAGARAFITRCEALGVRACVLRILATSAHAQAYATYRFSGAPGEQTSPPATLGQSVLEDSIAFAKRWTG